MKRLIRNSIWAVLMLLTAFTVSSQTYNHSTNVKVKKDLNLIGSLYKGSDKFLHNYIAPGSLGENVFLGRNAGNFTMDIGGGSTSLSSFNTGIGTLSLNAITKGWANTAGGYASLEYVTEGIYNTAFGVHSGGEITIGNRNSSFGHYSGYLTTTGVENSSFGASTFRGNQTGSYNSYFGTEAGFIAGNVSYNSAFGYKSQYKVTANYNSSFGMNSLLNTTSGQENTTGGFNSGGANITGSKNTYFGTNTAFFNTAGDNNVFIGFEAGYRELGSQKLFIDNQARSTDEATARREALIYGVFNTSIASQFLTFNVNKLTVSSGTINQNTYITDTSFGISRTSNGNEVVYLSKNLDLGVDGTANLHGYNGIQFKTGSLETVIATITEAGDFDASGGGTFGDGVLINGGVGTLSTGLSFGDGDSGIYESIDDRFTFALAGSNLFFMSSTYFETGNTRGARMQRATSTSTVPVFVFGSDTNTGLGSNASDELSLITGGVEALNIDFNQNTALRGDLRLADNKNIIVGDGSDLKIFHNGSNSYVDNVTGNLNLRNTGGDINFFTNGVQAINIDANQNITTIGNLNVGGGVSFSYVGKTAIYTIALTDYVVDCTANTFTTTLPTAAGITGKVFVIKNSGAGTITVDGNAAETIDGSATYVMATQYDKVKVMSNGTNWIIISN